MFSIFTIVACPGGSGGSLATRAWEESAQEQRSMKTKLSVFLSFTQPVLLIVAVLILVAGCSTEIVLSSKPDNAKLTVAKSLINGKTPITSSIRRTTFGKYPFRIEKDGYESLYGVLPLNVNGAVIALDVLFFAPATFWNTQRAFPFYEFDLEEQVIRYKNNSEDGWKEYQITEQEKAQAKSFFVAPPQSRVITPIAGDKAE